MGIRRVTGAVSTLAVVALALSACGDAAATGGWAGTVDTLANGVVLVSNPERGIWDESSAWRIEEELRIGSAEVEGPELFGNISALAVDPMGRIYVAESQAQEIRVFDANGEHVRTIGRKGGGPGEFQQISGMGWGADGNLWVMDPQNSRIAVIDTAGELVTSHRRNAGFVMIPWRGGFDGQGRLYDVSGAPGGGGLGGFRQVLIRYDESMTPVDTFWIPEYDTPSFDLVGEGGRRMMSANVPFAPGLVWTFDDDGHVWMGINDQYRLHRVTFEGDTLEVVEREHRPVPVTAEDREEALGRYEWFTQQGGKLDPSKVPSVKPAFSGPFFDDRGYLWINGSRAAGEPDAYDIFDPDGRYLGQITAPEGVSMQRPLVLGDTYYSVVTDDLDIPYVMRARIVGRDAMD
jgi:hypothetical protein